MVLPGMLAALTSSRSADVKSDLNLCSIVTYDSSDSCDSRDSRDSSDSIKSSESRKIVSLEMYF